MPAAAAEEYRAQLFESGLLIDTGLDGLYGRSGRFESIVSGIERLAASAGSVFEPEVRRFPPMVPRTVFERTGYLRSFPNLIGALTSFAGADREHAALLRQLDDGEDWTSSLSSADSVMCSAACHPLYPTIPGRLPGGGRRFDVYGWVYRHEPSLDPARQQAFRQYEHVYVGDGEGAEAHRDYWRDTAAELLRGLGIDVVVEVANDPFFGRAGRMLAQNQQDAQLKFEIIAPTSPANQATAISSANWHEDHFGEEFGIESSDGRAAHSACVGFGVERIALALLWAHGLDVDGWPADVRRQLFT